MSTAVSTRLRAEALGLLNKRSAILDLAREVSRLMRDAGIPGAVIGGIAVVLHDHVRTTTDIEVFTEGPLEPLAELLFASGFDQDPGKKEFVGSGIPVHLVTLEQLKQAPRKMV